MSKFQQLDLFDEIYELCHDYMRDINQQLSYYRASVYKNETAELVREQIAALAALVDLLPDDLVQEPFHDYQAECRSLVVPSPGECPFSGRVARLLQSLAEALEDLKERQWYGDGLSGGAQTHLLVENIYRSRDKMLVLCPPGSRGRALFERF